MDDEKKNEQRIEELEEKTAELQLKVAYEQKVLKEQCDRIEDTVESIQAKFSNGFKKEIIDAINEGTSSLSDKVGSFCRWLIGFAISALLSIVVTLVLTILRMKGIL
jgi:hypothetical protein